MSDLKTGYAHAEIATHSPAEVCAAAGKEISVEDLVTMSRGDALDLLTEGATQIMLQLLEDAPLRGALGIGGSTSSALACAVMRHLPLGFPKMCVSTMVSGDVSAYVGDTDICLMPSIGPSPRTTASRGICPLNGCYADSGHFGHAERVL